MLLTAIAAIIYWIITKVILSGESVFGGILLIAFLVFAALTLTYVALNEDLKERKQKAKPTLKNEITGKQDTAKLLEDKPFEPVPSVTEPSTELLPVINKTRKFK